MNTRNYVPAILLAAFCVGCVSPSVSKGEESRSTQFMGAADKGNIKCYSSHCDRAGICPPLPKGTYKGHGYWCDGAGGPCDCNDFRDPNALSCKPAPTQAHCTP
jgi:hypothetical protein